MTGWGTFYGTSPWGGTRWGGVGTSEGLPDINGSFERVVLGSPGDADLWSVTRLCSGVDVASFNLGAESSEQFVEKAVSNVHADTSGLVVCDVAATRFLWRNESEYIAAMLGPLSDTEDFESLWTANANWTTEIGYSRTCEFEDGTEVDDFSGAVVETETDGDPVVDDSSGLVVPVGSSLDAVESWVARFDGRLEFQVGDTFSFGLSDYLCMVFGRKDGSALVRFEIKATPATLTASELVTYIGAVLTAAWGEPGWSANMTASLVSFAEETVDGVVTTPARKFVRITAVNDGGVLDEDYYVDFVPPSIVGAANGWATLGVGEAHASVRLDWGLTRSADLVEQAEFDGAVAIESFEEGFDNWYRVVSDEIVDPSGTPIVWPVVSPDANDHWADFSDGLGAAWGFESFDETAWPSRL